MLRDDRAAVFRERLYELFLDVRRVSHNGWVVEILHDRIHNCLGVFMSWNE